MSHPLQSDAPAKNAGINGKHASNLTRRRRIKRANAEHDLAPRSTFALKKAATKKTAPKKAAKKAARKFVLRKAATLDDTGQREAAVFISQKADDAWNEFIQTAKGKQILNNLNQKDTDKNHTPKTIILQTQI